MKQYFTKYLPVEGEIKGREKVMYKGVIMNCHSVSSQSEEGKGNRRHAFCTEDIWPQHEIPVFLDECKKVKLFLCSRDIQVGDEARIPYPSGEARITPTKHTIISIRNVVAKNNGYKVIGEISPNAIWVKEGDEFDEEEIDYFFSGINTSYSLTKESFKTQGSYIRIKCPTCKTFH